MYPRIPQELVANPLGICEAHFGNHCPGQSCNSLVPMVPNMEVYQITLLSVQFTSFCNTGHTWAFIYKMTYIKVSRMCMMDAGLRFNKWY